MYRIYTKQAQTYRPINTGKYYNYPGIRKYTIEVLYKKLVCFVYKTMRIGVVRCSVIISKNWTSSYLYTRPDSTYVVDLYHH